MIIGALLFQTLFLFFPSIHDSDLKTTLVLYGISYKIIEFLLTMLVPLLVAAKNRKGVDKMTPSGTMLTVVNVFYYMGIFVLYGIVNLITFLKGTETDNHKDKLYTKIDRCVIILLLVLALIPTAPLVKHEYNNFNWRA
jgi:hypothetical protein